MDCWPTRTTANRCLRFVALPHQVCCSAKDRSPPEPSRSRPVGWSVATGTGGQCNRNPQQAQFQTTYRRKCQRYPAGDPRPRCQQAQLHDVQEVPGCACSCCRLAGAGTQVTCKTSRSCSIPNQKASRCLLKPDFLEWNMPMFQNKGMFHCCRAQEGPCFLTQPN